MTERPVVVVLATLDTKGREAEYLARCVEACGHPAHLIDIGLLGTPVVRADVSRAEVAGAARGLPADPGGDRQAAIQAVADGAGAILSSMLSAGRLAGVVALGGSKGTWIASTAMRRLPWGLPKMMVASTVPGDLRRYAGHSDLIFFSAVVDLAGLNAMTKLVLARAAAMIAQAVSTSVSHQPTGPSVAVTMAGVVTECGQRVEHGLRRRGFEPIVLPANGVGGVALEELVQSGRVGGVIELALLELSNQVVGGICAAAPGRLEAAARRGLPQIIVPGATDFANFAGRAGVPARYRHRLLVDHTPAITLMRLTDQESRRAGRLVGSKIAAATGPTEVIIPGRGFSSYDKAGAPFADPGADRAFVTGLRSALTGNHVAITERDEHINDPAFAEAVISAFERLSAAGPSAQEPAVGVAAKGRTWAQTR
jgi:uncharacterized protein (UPF0261 family)